MDGKFTLINVPENAILVVSYIGYLDREIPVAGKSTLEIRLKEDTQKLDEVVVVGYGVQKKVNMTGSISNVKADDLSVIPSTNLSNSLAGRAPGATITGNSGLMGAKSEIRMRGGFGDPLFVIDGVIRDKEAFDLLEPYEIDQMSFLKDAATASIYGSAAGNGVVLVTTKGGTKNQKPIFNYQGSYAFSKPTQELFADRWDAIDDLDYQNAVARFQGTPLPNGEEEYAYFRDNKINYNVNDYIWQNPWNTKHSLSVNGGTDKVKYYVMGSFLAEEGSYVSLENKKFSLRSNLSVDLTKYITMNVNLDANQSNDKRFYWPFSDDDDQSVYDLYRCTFNAMKTTPFYSYLDGTPANTITDYPIYQDYGSWQGWNPVDQVVGNRYLKTRRRNLNGIVSFNINLDFITKGLSTKVMASYLGHDYNRKRFMTFQKNYKFQQADPQGNRFLPAPLNLNEYNTFNFSQNYENLEYKTKQLWTEQFNWFVNYANTFGKHDVAAMVVFEQASNGGEEVSAKGESPLTNLDQMFNYSSDALRRWGEAKEKNGGRLSWIGRFNYTFDQKYIAEFSFRYDGNTLFPDGKRWGFFPSVAVGWNVSQENFFEPLKDVISNLKLRASYGLVGNDQLLDSSGGLIRFIYMSDITLQSENAGFTTGDKQQITLNGPVYTRYQNNDLTWEVGEKLNVGFDMQLFNSLNVTVDAFREIRRDIFQQRYSIPNYLGTASTAVYGNLAKVKNYGFDLSLDYGKQINKDLAIQFKGTFTFARNEILEYDEAPGVRPSLSNIGKKLNTIYGYVTDGLYIDQADIANSPSSTLGNIAIAPGDIKYVDQPDRDGVYDGKITSDDRVAMGYPTVPEIVYGFGPSISYKNWDFSFFFQGVANTSLMMSGFAPFGTQYNRNVLSWIADDYWSPSNQNPNAAYPRLTKNDNNHNTQSSDYWLRNGAFLKLKNAEIGYTWKKVRFYISGANLLTFSPFDLWDPEMGGGKGLSYPTQRTFNLGLQLSFK